MRCGLVAIVAVVAAGAGCAADQGEPGTWYGDVGPLVRTHCAGCHRENGIAPFSLHEYADAKPQMDRMLDAIDSGKMPPFSATSAADCTPRYGWRDDPRLTDDERATLHAWVAAGGPAGKPRDLPDIASTALDGANIHLAPTQPFETSGTRDQFACYLFDPQITHHQWLNGSQVFPGAPTFVHHVNVDLVAPEAAASAIAMIGGLGVPSFGCYNPPGLPIQSWLPGNPALLLPDSVGIPVDPGTLIAIQIHYHPAGGVGVDSTSLALRVTDDEPDWNYQLAPYGNSLGPPNLQPDPDDPPGGPPTFEIPANAADHVETMIMTHREDQAPLRVLTVTPHMHFLGTHERAVLDHANGDHECLVDSTWNFDWQRGYTYDADLDALPTFDASSKVTLSCTYNNSPSNPNLMRLLADYNRDQPYDVELGLTTADEMCLADFGLVTRN